MIRAALLVGTLGLGVAEDGAPSSSEVQQRLADVTREFHQLREETARDLAKIRKERVRQMAYVKALIEEPNRRLRGRRRLLGTAALEELQVAMDHMWLLLCGALVMFMQAGFAVFEAGACRAKHVQNILMKNLTDVCVGTICWWSFGWMLAYGGAGDAATRFAGYENYFGHDFHEEPRVGLITEAAGNMPLNWFFQWAFCSAAATIVSGGVAERVNFSCYLLYTVWMTAVIYPVEVAWTWADNGWLKGGGRGHINEVGYYDFAGSGVVHMCGGVGALVGACIVGPRAGRWDPSRAAEFRPHSLPLMVLGTFILWFGWYGFNCGSTLGMRSAADGQLAAVVAMNTTIAAAAGGVTVLALRYVVFRKFDIAAMCGGILAGLVSITAPCSNVESGYSLVIGILGAAVYQGSSSLLKLAKIDDPIEAFPVHGACGAWGVLATPLFDWGANFGTYHGSGFECIKSTATEIPDGCMTDARPKGILANLVGVLCIAAWSGALSAVLLLPLKYAGILRVREDVQETGLDLAKHSPAKAYASREVALPSASCEPACLQATPPAKEICEPQPAEPMLVWVEAVSNSGESGNSSTHKVAPQRAPSPAMAAHTKDEFDDVVLNTKPDTAASPAASKTSCSFLYALLRVCMPTPCTSHSM